MQKVFICSPYRASNPDPVGRAREIQNNLDLAREGCRIAVEQGYIPIAQFEEKAYETVYDPTSAQTEIDPSLVIIGKFWWMTRERDSDGTEGWFFHKKPEKAALPALDYRLKTNYLTTQTCIKDKLEKGGRRNGKKQS